MSSAVPRQSSSSPSRAQARVFRLSRLAYVIVLFLLFCVAPLAFTRDGGPSSRAVVGPQTLLLLIPIAAAFFIARTATVVDSSGVRVRALFGSRLLPWDEIRGLSMSDRSVYAVLADGSVRLPCVHVANLAEVARASGGRLPEVADPKQKFAPSRRSRR